MNKFKHHYINKLEIIIFLMYNNILFNLDNVIRICWSIINIIIIEINNYIRI